MSDYLKFGKDGKCSGCQKYLNDHRFISSGIPMTLKMVCPHNCIEYLAVNENCYYPEAEYFKCTLCDRKYPKWVFNQH